MAEDKKPTNVFVTPLGFISYPYLLKPDTGRPNSSNKYTAQLFISVEDFKTQGQALLAAVLEQGKILKQKDVKLNEFKHTITLVDALSPEQKAKLPESVRSGFVRINTASTRAPIVKGPIQSVLLSPEEIGRISGGDICRLVLTAYTYKQQGGGVALGLNGVQFKQKGPIAFGSGQSGVDMLTDLEVVMEDPTAGLGAAEAPAAKVATGIEALMM